MERRTLRNDGKITDARYLAQKTLRDYWTCGRALKRFFGKLRLDAIHVGHMEEYQRARAVCDTSACSGGDGDKWEKPCGANRIRKEMDMLVRILSSARLWDREEMKEDFVRVRKVDLDVPRAMDAQQQEHFLRVAASREEWQFVLWYANVGLQTAAATNELRSLQLGDVMLGQPGHEMIHIRPEGAKNRHRIRTVPLVGPSIWAMQHLVERARELGSAQPHHYLFPIQVAKGFYDPCRPMSDSGLKKRWDEVRTAAGLKWLRPYDLRHTGITRMAERGVPIDVAMDLVGHMTLQMHKHYTSISKGAKRNWLTATWDEPERKVKPVKLAAPVPKKAPASVSPVTLGTNQFSHGYAHLFHRTR